jgi:hypothetical protein
MPVRRRYRPAGPPGSALPTTVNKRPSRTEVVKHPRRTKAEVQLLRDTMHRFLANDHPQSVRHVFYLMTDPRLLDVAVEKSERGYRHVQYHLAEMRKASVLPYGWIVDSTRRGYFVAKSGVDFIRRMAGLYRADAWSRARAYVEVWAESRSIAAVIQDDCRELGVSLYPSAGFASLTLPYEAAEHIGSEVGGTGKTIEIIYVGDYDPAGVLIDPDIEKKIRDHLEVDFATDNPVTLHRLAITLEQIEAFRLPMKPRKEGERRAKHIQFTVEAEALPVSILRRLLRGEVESFMPRGALAIAKAAEESERAGLIALAEAWERRR